jgi:DNA polymerase-3 subunit beta
MKYSYNTKIFHIKINDYVIISKLIEGNYPNFNKVIPERTTSEIIVDKLTLKNSLNIISKVVNQQYKGVKLTPNNNTMHLISSNTDSEIGEDQIDVEYSGEEISIGFNISYLQDVIDTLEGDTIHICINDQNSGCVIQDNQDQDSTFVIMPMRV